MSRIGRWREALSGDEQRPFALITLSPEALVEVGKELLNEKLVPLLAYIFPVGDTGWNADGLVALNSWEPTESVATFFSTGILEVATTAPFIERSSRSFLFGNRLDHLVIASTRAAADDDWPPEAVFLDVSLMNLKGVRLAREPEFPTAAAVYPREIVHVRQTIAGSEGRDADQRVKPLLDQLWRAGGASRALSFDENGLWKPWRSHFGPRDG
jgi:hypothetical protein